MSATSNLPSGWTETTFGAVVSAVSVNDKKLPRGQYLESGRFPVVDQGRQFIGGYSNDETRVISEDLPVLVFGDHTRAFKYLNQPFVPGADGVKVLKPLGVDPKWLFEIAHALDFPDKGYARHYQHLKSAKLFVPPLPDQRRIVAEIEKQFTRLEAGVAALRRLQANLKRYRAAILKAACEGRLVPTEAELAKAGNRKAIFESGEALLARILIERRQNWQGRGRYKEPAALDTAELPQLPKGWTWATLDQIGQEGRPIIYGIIKPGPHIPDGVPYVRVTEMKDGRIDVPNLKRASRERAAKFSRATLASGDVLISKDGTIGRVAVVPPELAGGNITQHVMRAPIHSIMLRDYVVWAVRSDWCQHWLTGQTRGVALRGVNVEDFRRLPIPVPPLVEQTRIVAEVERRLSVVKELESVVSANLQRAIRLRQSILQKAFTGKL